MCRALSLRMSVCTHAHTVVHVWGPEDNSVDSVIFFSHLHSFWGFEPGPLGLCDKHPYLLSEPSLQS